MFNLLKPTEKELNDLGISEPTYVENDFFLAKLGGLCRWHVFYTGFYLFTMAYGFVTSCFFVYYASLEGEKQAVLEVIHFVPIIFNMTAQVVSYHYTQGEFNNMFQVIDRGVFDYEDTLNEEMKNHIDELKQEARSRKRVYGRVYLYSLAIANVGQIGRKPIIYLFLERGVKRYDGDKNLIMAGPFGMYLPFADNWIVYTVGLFLGNACLILTVFTVCSAILIFLYISEELLAEYDVVKFTFSKCVERAELLYQRRTSEMTTEGKVSSGVTMEVCLNQCLKVSARHHLQTLKMYDVFKRITYIPLFTVIFDGAIILCISAFFLISEDVTFILKLSMPIVIAVEALIAFIFCYYGEKLSQANSDVGDSVYECSKWPDYSKVILPYAIIVKGFCSIPNNLSAAGFSSVNHETFGNMLSTAYSFIGFLLSK